MSFPAQKLKIRNHDVTAGWQGDHLPFFEPAQLSAHCFKREAKVVRHLGAGQGQFKVHVIFWKDAVFCEPARPS